MQVEEEQRGRDDLREQLSLAERRAQILQSEKEELAINFEQVRPFLERYRDKLF